jgi:8-oxo-dGTP diphosphatase
MKEIEVLARGVMVRKGRILLCRNRETGNVYLPGGHIEHGESGKTALGREIAEELGFPAKIGRFLGAAEHTFVHRGRRTCEVNFVFEMSVRGLRAGSKVRSREKKLEFLWVPMSKLSRSALEPRVLRACLARWLNNRSAANWASSYRSC